MPIEYKYKIRKIVSNNSTGDVFGITVPTQIAKQFGEVFFRFKAENNKIILESGCRI